MSILENIKKEVKKSGSSKSKFTYFKADSKVRVRFLQDVEDGLRITFHDSFSLGINVPCQEVFGRECEYCGNDDLRTRDLYAWTVYNYENNKVEILMAPVNNFSPIPALVGMYEAYGTLLDRDYVITRTGAQTNTSYSVVPMDKNKFKNKKAKAYSHDDMLKLIDKAFPDENAEDDDDEDEVVEKKATKKSKAKTKAKKSRIPEPEEDDEEEFEDWEDEEEEEEDEIDYEEMTAKELYKLCKEKGINVKPKKTKAFYIDKLEEFEEDEDDMPW